jgi:hypothetical protein
VAGEAEVEMEAGKAEAAKAEAAKAEAAKADSDAEKPKAGEAAAEPTEAGN